MIYYTANQPHFFPPIYMVNRAALCDYVVIMGQAQFSKHGWQHECQLASPQGKHMLRLNLEDRNGRPLDKIRLVDGQMAKIKATLHHFYGKSEGWECASDCVLRLLDELGESNPTVERVGRLTLIHALHRASICSDRHTAVLPDTTFHAERPENPSQWLAEMGERIGTIHPTEKVTYVCGGGALGAYLDMGEFTKRGIEVQQQNYVMQPYKNSLGENTDARYSYLDLLFSVGKEDYRRVIRDLPVR